MTDDTLTPAEREWVIERVLSWYQNQWARREIQAARDEDEAIRWCHKFLTGSYAWPATYGRVEGSIRCRRDGVEAEVNGHRERIPWLQIVRAARAEARQLVMF